MGLRDLKLAYIRPVNGQHAGEQIDVLFNPAEYSIEKGNSYQSTGLPGMPTPVTQFVNGNADSLSMELYFDTYAPSLRHITVIPREDVRNYTRKISNLLEIDPTLHAPPIVEFTWGSPLGTPEGVQFTGIIEKLSQKFTFFLDDGTPVRAILNITFKEYKTIQQQLQEMGRQSADRTKTVVVEESDSLWFYSSQEYGDPDKWRAIADKNDIDNPRLLTPGTSLEIPPLS